MRCVPAVLLLYVSATFPCSMVPAARAANTRRPGAKHAAAAKKAPSARDSTPAPPRAGSTISEVAVSALPGWAVGPLQKPASKEFWAILQNPAVGEVKPRQSKMLNFTRGSERATVVYLEYETPEDAARVLPQIRTRLWGGETVPPSEAPHLLRAGNLISIVEARTLAVTLAVSRGLLPAGAVQDAADSSAAGTSASSPSGPAEVPAGGPKEVPARSGPREVPAEVSGEAGDSPTGALDPVDLTPPQGPVPNSDQIAAGLGRYAEAAADAGKLLQEQHYAEALGAYQAYQRSVDRDPGAGDLPRWDAATGVGLSAAYAGKMQLARDAFTRALQPATRLDARKLAETYFNLACAEAELGNKTAVFTALSGCLTAARRAGSEQHYRQVIRTDKSLRAVQSDPRIKKL